MRVDEHFLRRLDNLRRAEPDLPSRTEMARRLIEGAFEEAEAEGLRGTEDRLQSGREKRARADAGLGSPRSKLRAQCVDVERLGTRLPTLIPTLKPTSFPTSFYTRLPIIIPALIPTIPTLIPTEKLFGELSL
jgi:hypothetical protein